MYGVEVRSRLPAAHCYKYEMARNIKKFRNLKQKTTEGTHTYEMPAHHNAGQRCFTSPKSNPPTRAQYMHWGTMSCLLCPTQCRGLGPGSGARIAWLRKQ